MSLYSDKGAVLLLGKLHLIVTLKPITGKVLTSWLLSTYEWRWSCSLPETAADVLPGNIQCVWEGQQAAQQSTEEKLHLRSGPRPKPGSNIFVFMSSLFLISFLSTCSPSSQKAAQWEAVSLPLLSTLPFFPPLSPMSRLVAPAQPERSKPPAFLCSFPGEVRATSFYSARRRAF